MLIQLKWKVAILSRRSLTNLASSLFFQVWSRMLLVLVWLEEGRGWWKETMNVPETSVPLWRSPEGQRHTGVVLGSTVLRSAFCFRKFSQMMEWKKRPNRKLLQNSGWAIMLTWIKEERKELERRGKASADTEPIGFCGHLWVRINKEPKTKSKIIAEELRVKAARFLWEDGNAHRGHHFSFSLWVRAKRGCLPEL